MRLGADHTTRLPCVPIPPNNIYLHVAEPIPLPVTFISMVSNTISLHNSDIIPVYLCCELLYILTLPHPTTFRL